MSSSKSKKSINDLYKFAPDDSDDEFGKPKEEQRSSTVAMIILIKIYKSSLV